MDKTSIKRGTRRPRAVAQALRELTAMQFGLEVVHYGKTEPERTMSLRFRQVLPGLLRKGQ